MIRVVASADPDAGFRRVDPGEQFPSGPLFVELFKPDEEEILWCRSALRMPKAMFAPSLRSDIASGIVVVRNTDPLLALKGLPSDIRFVVLENAGVAVLHELPWLFASLPPLVHADIRCGQPILLAVARSLVVIAEDRLSSVRETINEKAVGLLERSGVLRDELVSEPVDLGHALTELVVVGATEGLVTAATELLLIASRAESRAGQTRDLVELVSSSLERKKALVDAFLSVVTVALESQRARIERTISVVGLITLPSILIASIYGMNFEYMPEVEYRWAYPLVLLVMLTTGVLSFFLARRRKWI